MQTTSYDQQAEKFLSDNGITFRATLSDSKPAPWINDHNGSPFGTEAQKSRHHYRVTLSKGKPCTPEYTGNIRSSARLTFDFWGSIKDAEEGIKTVTPYDVLACISGDAHCPETFEDFCSEYGHESDSIKALQTFRRCSAFAKRLQAFFTAAEIEQLQEIQ